MRLSLQGAAAALAASHPVHVVADALQLGGPLSCRLAAGPRATPATRLPALVQYWHMHCQLPTESLWSHCSAWLCWRTSSVRLAPPGVSCAVWRRLRCCRNVLSRRMHASLAAVAVLAVLAHPGAGYPPGLQAGTLAPRRAGQPAAASGSGAPQRPCRQQRSVDAARRPARCR